MKKTLVVALLSVAPAVHGADELSFDVPAVGATHEVAQWHPGCTFRSERYSRRHHAQNQLDAKVAELRNQGFVITGSRVTNGGRDNYWYFEVEYMGGSEQTLRSERYSRRHHAQNEMDAQVARLRSHGGEIISAYVTNGGRDNYWYYEIRYIRGCRN
ncbi:MAG: hypothetical protein HY553_00940 [Elusimicrobia bacterium]|nr:hypothetical protein [Elusimicrobiota bacterium]